MKKGGKHSEARGGEGKGKGRGREERREKREEQVEETEGSSFGSHFDLSQDAIISQHDAMTSCSDVYDVALLTSSERTTAWHAV